MIHRSLPRRVVPRRSARRTASRRVHAGLDRLARAASPPLASAVAVAWLAGAGLVAPAAGQYRFGISAGGASTVAFVAEYRWQRQGMELQLGTWGFRDASVTLTAKQYFGSNAVEPFVGAGLWGVFARAETGSGMGLIARLPAGFDARFSGNHWLGAAVYLNRALALRRPDPEDLRPPRRAFVPLPEFSYRWRPRQ